MSHNIIDSDIDSDADENENENESENESESESDMITVIYGDQREFSIGNKSKKDSEFFGFINDKKVKWIVSGVVGTVLLFRRDLFTTRMTTGAVVSAIECKILKMIINQPRPPQASLVDAGMPSSHAQSLMYFASYLSTSLMLTDVIGDSIKSGLIIGLLWSATFLSFRRTKSLHTAPQVLAGLSLGAINGFLWRTILGRLFIPESTTERILAFGSFSLVVVGFLSVGSLERAFRKYRKPSQSVQIKVLE